MIPALANLIHRTFGIEREQAVILLTRSAVAFAAIVLVAASTLILAFDSFFPGRSLVGALTVGQVATRDIHAPVSRTYVSTVLTEQRRAEAAAAVQPVYNAPDLTVARVQTALAGRILDFIDNIRRDPYATPEQRIADIQQVTALRLDSQVTIPALTQMSDDIWTSVRAEVLRLLEQVMQDSIRESELPGILERLPNQVALRFDSRDVAIVADIVSDLIRPNRALNVDATEAARLAAAEAVPNQVSSFQRGQLVVAAGTMLEPPEVEALQELGLIQPLDQRWPHILRAGVASLIALVLFGQYLIRFHPQMLQKQPRIIWLLAILMLIMLVTARFAAQSTIYLYPAGALALLYVAMAAPGVGLIGTLGLALLAGLIGDNSLEFAMLVMADGAICVLSLRRPERLNSYIFAGLMVSVVNVALLLVFNLGQPTLVESEDVLTLIGYSLLNGVITAAVTLVGLYLLGQIFNLPTVLRLVELNQPSNSLLQRLLREAPGTYQHSLQVGNLCEQAANSIGANASLISVAALYHDIGKLHAPLFFTENQRGIENPHDALNDPERSARIIIAHVSYGETLARQHRLPARLVDFIREHHGNSLVKVFYQQALIRAGDDETRVLERTFRYPGPKPQSRETAIMMLADSCDAALRAAQVKTRADIELHVGRIVDSYREAGQLDECGLTLADLKTIEAIFVNMIEATTHPRINYDAVIARARQTQHMQAIRVERPQPDDLTDDNLPWNMRLPGSSGTSDGGAAAPTPPLADDKDPADDSSRTWD